MGNIKPVSYGWGIIEPQAQMAALNKHFFVLLRQVALF